MLKWGKYVAVATLVVMFIPATAKAAKDELIIGISQFPTGFHPNLSSHVALSLIHGMTRRSFTVYDADWKLICLLCAELPTRSDGTIRDWQTEDGTPGLEVDYAIRDDAVWGDGTPVTTKDVLFTWQVGRVPEAGINNQELYRRMENIVALDDKRFTIQWNKRTCDAEAINDFEIVPAHLEATAAEDPAQYRSRNIYDSEPTNAGLYFGPYRISRVEPGASVTLEPNPTWWGQKPQFKRIVVRTIENTAALEANLLSGEIDYIAGEDGISLDQALTFQKRHGDEYNVVFKPGLFYEHIDLNLDNSILSDLRVRQALLHAIDREAMSERLFEGKQPVAHTSIHPLDSVHVGEVRKYAFDTKRAGELLDEAGWTDIRGGVRHNAAGEPLRLEIMTTSGNRVRELVEQVIQSNLRDAGVDLRIRNEPARVYFGRTLRQREYTGLAMFAWFSSPQNVPRTTLHSTMIPTAENSWSGQNYTGYVSPAMDEAIDKVEVECGAAEQAKWWRTIQTEYAENLPVLPLYFRANAFIMPKWLSGVTPTGHQYPSTLWIENWTAQ
ncbi:MAG: peptide ABC transporter substrate-binding protein [Alphaproteobacteria bacterium]|nr:peptide ABC transporter substrate-binding protein [Alphaproteobacteria bacterium]